MRTWILVVFAMMIGQVFGQVDTTFSNLRGLDDAAGNTHLFYRKLVRSYYQKNSVYHLDLAAKIDTFFLYEGEDWSFEYDKRYTSVADYEFWDNNPGLYIYGGAMSSLDPQAYIGSPLLGGFQFVESFWLNNIEISQQHSNRVYFSGNGLFISNDSGMTWTSLGYDEPMLVALAPFDDSLFFSTDLEGKLLRSRNAGISYSAVDTAMTWDYSNTSMFFDRDSLHIYAVTAVQDGTYFLRSADMGDSWDIMMKDTTAIIPAIDAAVSGTVYLCTSHEIRESNDYGNTFITYATLDSTIVGIYKKPGVDIVYAATPKHLYRITAGIASEIRDFPVGIKGKLSLSPSDYVLSQNYPNPFNPETTIHYTIPRSMDVQLTIYSVLGEKISALVNEYKTAGSYQTIWKGTKSNGRKVSSGIYIYELKVGGQRIARKMLLAK